MLASGCGTGTDSVSISSTTRAPETAAPTSPVSSSPVSTSPVSTSEGRTSPTFPTATSDDPISRSADGRFVPAVPDSGGDVATAIERTEAALRDPTTDPAALPDIGHEQQVLYRHLGRHPEWDADVLAAVPPELTEIVRLQLAARRAFYALHTGYADRLPSWRIVAPEPASRLLEYYREGEELYGIEWEYLAAINLVETGMGRIAGLSTAGAQGPMQFIPATWADYGEGDVNDPHDAIIAAARYLNARGGPDDMDAALFGYNNHNAYVEGVSNYAEIMRRDPDAFTGFYHWEIHFASHIGDLWLPVGFEEAERVLITAYVREHPESAPPENGWVPNS